MVVDAEGRDTGLMLLSARARSSGFAPCPRVRSGLRRLAVEARAQSVRVAPRFVARIRDSARCRAASKPNTCATRTAADARGGSRETSDLFSIPLSRACCAGRSARTRSRRGLRPGGSRRAVVLDRELLGRHRRRALLLGEHGARLQRRRGGPRDARRLEVRRVARDGHRLPLLLRRARRNRLGRFPPRRLRHHTIVATGRRGDHSPRSSRSSATSARASRSVNPGAFDDALAAELRRRHRDRSVSPCGDGN